MKDKTKVIAHRGFWKGSAAAQNSLSGLEEAGRAKIFGCELDVQITSDFVPVVFHDKEAGGMILAKTPGDILKKCRLSNGETIPLLSEYLTKALDYPSMKLFIEVKPQATRALEQRAAFEVVSHVRKAGIEPRLEFISFSIFICKELQQMMPHVPVSVLSEKFSPSMVKALGLTGVDFDHRILLQNPEMIANMHMLGLSVNAWTVNNPDSIRILADRGADYVTTDNPLEAIRIIDSI